MKEINRVFAKPINGSAKTLPKSLILGFLYDLVTLNLRFRKRSNGARQPDLGRLTGLGKNKVQSVKIHKGKRSATKRTEEKNEEEIIEEGLAERQSLLCLDSQREFFDHLHYEEMQSDLEDLAQEELMRNELMRVLGEL